jgi:hypothetical protein
MNKKTLLIDVRFCWVLKNEAPIHNFFLSFVSLKRTKFASLHLRRGLCIRHFRLLHLQTGRICLFRWLYPLFLSEYVQQFHNNFSPIMFIYSIIELLILLIRKIEPECLCKHPGRIAVFNIQTEIQQYFGASFSLLALYM